MFGFPWPHIVSGSDGSNGSNHSHHVAVGRRAVCRIVRMHPDRLVLLHFRRLTARTAAELAVQGQSGLGR
jgi:hypothetical protein